MTTLDKARQTAGAVFNPRATPVMRSRERPNPVPPSTITTLAELSARLSCRHGDPMEIRLAGVGVWPGRARARAAARALDPGGNARDGRNAAPVHNAEAAAISIHPVRTTVGPIACFGYLGAKREPRALHGPHR